MRLRSTGEVFGPYGDLKRESKPNARRFDHAPRRGARVCREHSLPNPLVLLVIPCRIVALMLWQDHNGKTATMRMRG